MLVFPTALGIFTWCATTFSSGVGMDGDRRFAGASLVLFGFSICIWSTLLTSYWQRKNRLLNLWWGGKAEAATRSSSSSSSSSSSAVHPRPEFVGVLRRNPVTDTKELQYFSKRDLHRKMAAGLVVVAMLVVICVAAVAGIFALRYWMVRKRQLWYGAMATGALNGIQISVLNEVYLLVAQGLTTSENHRTHHGHDDALIAKTFLFQFVNSYAAFFYIAFLKDWTESTALGESTHSTFACSATDTNASAFPNSNPSTAAAASTGTASEVLCDYTCSSAVFLQREGINATDLTASQAAYWAGVEHAGYCG